jgi:hypothetical protein
MKEQLVLELNRLFYKLKKKQDTPNMYDFFSLQKKVFFFLIKNILD